MPVYGLIGAKWLEFGGESGVFGGPITGEIDAPALDGCRVTHFERGSIYWSPTHGMMPLYGFIGAEWRLLGGEKGSQGLPISGEVDNPGVPGGRRTRFQWGTIVWHPDTGVTVEN